MKNNAIKGNLITMAKNGDFEVIVHGQNCIHGWGAGIAKDIARNFPLAKKADLETRHSDKKKMGTYSHATIKLDCGKEIIVVNAYTQLKFGQGVHLNYRALREVMNAINKDFEGKNIAYPKIGAGRAGGDWKSIIDIIDDELISVDHTLVIL
jgi:O-acetyl-ADP-ribose deacetylase (regulator of RNase III)